MSYNFITDLKNYLKSVKSQLDHQNEASSKYWLQQLNASMEGGPYKSSSQFLSTLQNHLITTTTEKRQVISDHVSSLTQVMWFFRSNLVVHSVLVLSPIKNCLLLSDFDSQAKLLSLNSLIHSIEVIIKKNILYFTWSLILLESKVIRYMVITKLQKIEYFYVVNKQRNSFFVTVESCDKKALSINNIRIL